MDTPGNYSQLGGRGKRFRFFSRYEKAHQYRELPEKEVPRKRKTTGKTATGNLPPAGQKLPRMERPRIGFVRSPKGSGPGQNNCFLPVLLEEEENCLVRRDGTVLE